MISETELRGTGATPEEWLREYALLALRVNRLVTEGNGGTVLIYQGPPEWEAQVAAEATQPSGCLVEDAGRLLDAVPFEPTRAAWLAAQVRAMQAIARRLGDPTMPLAEHARECLGIDVAPVAGSVFEEAHDRLDRALPPGGGTIAERLHGWRDAHVLRPDRAACRSTWPICCTSWRTRRIRATSPRPC